MRPEESNDKNLSIFSIVGDQKVIILEGNNPHTNDEDVINSTIGN
jgi:hypothetical protein